MKESYERHNVANRQVSLQGVSVQWCAMKLKGQFGDYKVHVDSKTVLKWMGPRMVRKAQR